MVAIHVVQYDELPGAGTLGRHAEHDPRSRAFAVEAPAPVGPVVAPVAVEWPRYSPILNQLRVRSCTGNAMAGWLGCGPHVASATDAARYDETCALKLYEVATKLDRIPGYYMPADPASVDTGSTGTAVAKAARRLGLIGSYGWAFTTTDLLFALQSGPVLIGSEWLSGMDHPDHSGFVQVAGSVRGGHEYLVRGYRPSDGYTEAYLLCSNSWGAQWGPLGGEFKLPLSGWEILRSQWADVVVPKV